MSADNTGCVPALDPCDFPAPSMYHGTTVAAEVAAHVEGKVCAANDSNLCGIFDICTAEGAILTQAGNFLGWPREHCNVKPVEFFGLQCVVPPPVGTGCEENSVVGLCEGGFFFCRLDASENYTFTDDDIYRSFLKAVSIKNRARRFKQQSNVKLIEEIISELWGDAAYVFSAGDGVIRVTAGRDLTEEEICILSLYQRVICVGLGIRLEIFCEMPELPKSCSAPRLPPNGPFMDVCDDGDTISRTRGTFIAPDGSAVTLTQTGLPPNLTFNDNGNGTWTITGTCDDSGTSTYTVTGSGGGASCDLTGNTFGQLAVVPNSNPVADGPPPANQEITDGDNIAPMNFADCFSDVDGDILSYDLMPPIAGLSIDDSTGIVTGSPTGLSAPWPNVVIVEVQADDGNGGTGFCTATVIVNEDAPPPNPPTLSGIVCGVQPAALSGEPSPQFASDGGQTVFCPFSGSGTLTINGVNQSWLRIVNGNCYSIEVPANAAATGAVSYSVTLTNADGAITCSGNTLEIIGL